MIGWGSRAVTRQAYDELCRIHGSGVELSDLDPCPTCLVHAAAVPVFLGGGLVCVPSADRSDVCDDDDGDDE